MSLMNRSFCASSLLASVRDSYLILSRASEELEINSLRKFRHADGDAREVQHLQLPEVLLQELSAQR